MIQPPNNMFSMQFPGSPQARSKGMALSSYQVQHHDIDAEEFLREIDLLMYKDVLLTNFAIHGTNYLNRKRLSTIRMQDLPKMGITQYDHQRHLLDHIQHTLEFEFNSPVRKRQVLSKMEERFPGKDLSHLHPPVKVSKLKVEDLHIPHRDLPKRAANTETISRRRRRSFDKMAWDSINHLRTSDAESHNIAEALRAGHKEVAIAAESKANDRRRRRSFDSNNAGTSFGNRALTADLIHTELHLLQSQHMKRCKRLVGCEEAHICFIHERTHDLLLVTEHSVWYRLPMGFSSPGQCAEQGTVLNITNAYEDAYFNSNLDDKLHMKTKSVLCYPVRGNRGAGAVIGVLMCTNKNDDDGNGNSNNGSFDDSDVDQVASIATNIADDLHSKFRELTTIADIMYGSAVFVNAHNGGVGMRQSTNEGSKKGGVNGPSSTLTKKTAASEGHRVHAYDATAHANDGIHDVHGAAMHHNQDQVLSSHSLVESTIDHHKA
jgi:hypothetical protein